MYKILGDFIKICRKHGFTLAEALVVTVMAGYCLLPILGTMQNAQVRVEKFDHQANMQRFARSRLTNEIANASFDHNSINLEDEYHYIVYFASSTANTSANKEDAKLIELPRSYVTLENLNSLTDSNKKNWSAPAVSLLGISKNKGAPYLEVVHAYKTSVEVKDNPGLAKFGNTGTTDDSIETPKALLGIVVKCSLIYSDGQKYAEDDGSLLIKTATSTETSTETPSSTSTETSTETKDSSIQVAPVTLFSFVNLPTVSDEMIWLADAYNCRIYGIDPVAKSVSTIINLTYDDSQDVKDSQNDKYRPWHLAVQPSLKLLAVMREKTIDLIDIDKKSSTYSKVYNNNISLTFAKQIGSDGKQAYTDAALAFRTDGKFLFAFSSSNHHIYAYELSYNTNNEPILTEKGNYNFVDIEVINKMIPASDGNLYIGLSSSKIVKMPMYQSDWVNWKPVDFKTVNNLSDFDISPDGVRLAAVSDKKKISIYDTRDGTVIDEIENKEIKTINTQNDFEKSMGIAFSLSSSTTEIADEKSLKLFMVNENAGDDKYLLKSFYGKSPSASDELKNKTDDDIKGGKIVVSPDNQTLVFNNYEKPFVYLGTTENKESAETLNKNDENILEFSKKSSFSDMVSSKRDILAVAASKTVKLYDLNTLKEIEGAEFEVPHDITSLAMSPNGDMLAGGYAKLENNTSENEGRFHLHLSDFSNKISDSDYRKKLVFDDRVPNMLFVLEDPKNTKDDAFWNINNDPNDWSETSGSAYDRKDFQLDPVWKRLDIIGMPRGGAMVLYGKDDGSSMLEWIGRRNWAQDPQKGKYKLFARWTSNNRSLNSMDIPATYNKDNFVGLNLDSIDSWQGRIFIVHIQKFPVNSVIESCTGKASSKLPSGETRYITPLIVEYTDSDHKNIKVIDYANSIDFSSSSELKEDYKLTWVNGGKIINDNCRVGFYSGGPAGPNEGVIGFAQATNVSQVAEGNFEYLADYYSEKITNSDYGDSEKGAIDYSEIIDFTTTFKQYPKVDTTQFAKFRKYALIFKSADINNEDTIPPVYSKKLAISPDCSQLAILSGKDNTDAKLSMYDFNNQIYGSETQIEGMLIDYRKGFTTNSFSETGEFQGPVYPWPAEKDVSFFKEVQQNCGFSKRDSKDTSVLLLKNATSKNDSWESFNKYPANYFVDKNNSTDLKILANKRFFGYFRPEIGLKYLQRAGSEDVRIFFNRVFKAGKSEVYHGNFVLDNPISLDVEANESGILQLDETSNDGYGAGNVFLSENKSSFDNMYLHWGSGDSISGKTNNVDCHSGNSDLTKGYCSTSLPGINNLNSSETFILKNEPALMWSKVAYTEESKPIDNCDIIFSQDKSNPILYGLDSKNKVFWGIGSTSSGISINFKIGNLGDINSNLIMSKDGQKLIFSRGNYLNFYDISNPNSTSFPAFISSYPISINNNVILASKPFSFYNSSKIGGTYRNIINSEFDTFTLEMNGSMTVASGGIYIYSNAKKGFLCYNPTTGQVASFPDVLKKEAPYSPITSYNNTIYVFGSDRGDIEDNNEPTDRIQSYNPTTDKALSSLDGSNFTNLNQSNYIVSLNANGYNSIRSVTASTQADGFPYYKKGEYVFDGNNNVWVSGYNPTSSDITYDYKIDYPFVVNSIFIDNRVYFNGRKCGVKNFELYHDSIESSNLLLSGEMPNNTQKSFDVPNSTPYKKYILRCKDSHDSLGYRVGVRELYFYRKGVSLLTPSSGWTKKESNFKHIEFDDASIGKITVKSNEKDLHDLLNSSPNHYWGNFSNPVKKSYILFSFETPVKADIIRIRNLHSNNNYLKAFKIYGFIGAGAPEDDSSIGDNNANEENWRCLGDFSGLKGCSEILTYEFSNPDTYRHYLFKMVDCDRSECDISKLELWSSSSSAGSSSETPTDNYLTPLLDDDLKSIKVGATACCATPYGLVMAGGHVDNNGSSYATTTALLYWPHAVNKYDGTYYEYGISRSLPPLNNKRFNHTLVWHKGIIYAIGGSESLNSAFKPYDKDKFIEYLDYNKEMNWKIYSSYIFVDDANEASLGRYYHGACSFRDEIFIFGGRTNSNTSGRLTGAFAFNPETGVVRKIEDLPGAIYPPISAVAYGAKIYVAGRDSTGQKLVMYEYTP